ncbi:MAG: hypothetical protein IRZ08_19365 [Frankia sp.]|nr:hypothetical protein [Frankia sp.]
MGRAWRYLIDPRRRTAVVFALIALAGLVAFGAYATMAGPPPKVEAIVVFDANATDEQKEAVRTACPTMGEAKLEPPGDPAVASNRAYPVRYDLSGASAADKAALYRCVQAQPGVIGITEYTDGQ